MIFEIQNDYLVKFLDMIFGKTSSNISKCGICVSRFIIIQQTLPLEYYSRSLSYINIKVLLKLYV